MGVPQRRSGNETIDVFSVAKVVQHGIGAYPKKVAGNTTVFAPVQLSDLSQTRS